MRMSPIHQGLTVITLSERNLRELVRRLDAGEDVSASKTSRTHNFTLVIEVERDEDHYDEDGKVL